MGLGTDHQWIIHISGIVQAFLMFQKLDLVISIISYTLSTLLFVSIMMMTSINLRFRMISRRINKIFETLCHFDFECLQSYLLHSKSLIRKAIGCTGILSFSTNSWPTPPFVPKFVLYMKWTNAKKLGSIFAIRQPWRCPSSWSAKHCTACATHYEEERV